MRNRTLCRKWLLTISRPREYGYDHETIKAILKNLRGICYWCMCDEVGRMSGIYHTHLLIVGENAIPFSTVKNRFPAAHIEECVVSDDEVISYIKKEGKYNWDRETTFKETFEEGWKKSSIVSEVIQMLKRFYRRKRH